MTNYATYSEALRLHINTAKQEIKAAYRRLAHKWHPDHQGDPAGSEAAQGESSSEGSHASTFMTILKYVAILAVVALGLWLIVTIFKLLLEAVTGIAIIALIIFVARHVI